MQSAFTCPALSTCVAPQHTSLWRSTILPRRTCALVLLRSRQNLRFRQCRYTNWHLNLIHGVSAAVFVSSRTVDSLLPLHEETLSAPGVTHTHTGTPFLWRVPIRSKKQYGRLLGVIMMVRSSKPPPCHDADRSKPQPRHDAGTGRRLLCVAVLLHILRLGSWPPVVILDPP